MPPPITAVPKTHRVSVNLGQTLTNIQRALTLVYTSGAPISRRPEFTESPDEESKNCYIASLSTVRTLMQPAIDAPSTTYTKRWYEGRWAHILSYQNQNKETQHLFLTPTSIFTDKWDCTLDQGLAYYLSVALDITPPTSAQDEADAAMVGYIRCFGAGNMDCPRYMDYAPPLEPPPVSYTPPPYGPDIETIFKYQSLASKAQNSKVRQLYLNKVTKEALHLAQDVRQNAEKAGVPAKDVKQLITNFTPQFNIDDQKRDDAMSYEEEVARLSNAAQKFMTTLFGTIAWQHDYKRFRNNFLDAGCTERTDNTSGTCNVDCSRFGYQFDVKTETKPQVTKAN